MANYDGDRKDNTYRGTKKRDQINGNGGNDQLYGLAGDDEIDGGEGNDLIDVGVGDDDADGGEGKDTLIIDHGAAKSRSPGAIDLEWSRTGYSGVFESSLGKTRFEDFEILDLTLGAANDRVTFDGAGLTKGAKVTIDAGDGGDVLDADLSALSDVTFKVASNGSATTLNATFAKFEVFELTLGDGLNTIVTGKLGDTIVSAKGGIDMIDGGAGFDTYIYRAADDAGLALTLNGTAATLSNGGSLKNIETMDFAFGNGDDAVTLRALSPVGDVHLAFGGGNDRFVAETNNTKLSLYQVVEMGDGDDTIEVIGSGGLYVDGGGIAGLQGGAGADTFRFSATGESALNFAGGDDAAIDSVIISMASFRTNTNGGFTITSGLTASANGLSGTVSTWLFTGLAFSGVENVSLALSRGQDSYTIDRAAMGSGLAFAVDGGIGSDLLTLDLTDRPDVTYQLNADGTVTSTVGALTGFEQFNFTLGAGANRITTGIGNDTIVGSGGLDTIDLGGNTRVGGVNGIDRYSGTSTDSDGLVLGYDGITATVSNGTTVIGAEAFEYSAGSGDDSFMLSGTAVATGVARATLYGNDGDDTFTIETLGTGRLFGGAGFDTLNVTNGGFSIDADADGLNLDVNNGNGAFGFETIHVVQTSGLAYSGATVRRAAIASGLSFSIDAGDRTDILFADYGGVASASFLVDSSNVVTASHGNYRSFEIFHLTLSGGRNEIRTQFGDDRIIGTGGIDIVDTGAGIDAYESTLSNAGGTYTFTAGRLVGSNGTDVVNFESLYLKGGTGADVFVVRDQVSFAQSSQIEGGAGDDFFSIDTRGSSTWQGGLGSDTFRIGLGSARIWGFVIPQPGGERGPDTGTDTVIMDLTWSTAAIVGSITAKADGLSGTIGISGTFEDIEIVELALGAGGDEISLSSAALASGFAIILDGNGGIDTVGLDYSANSNVTFAVGADGAIVAGSVSITDFEAVAVTTGAGTNSVSGGAFADRLSGSNLFDAIGRDTLDGKGGDDRLSGFFGDDVLIGGEGNDKLDGGEGLDSLNGGNGNDLLIGGEGNDALKGDDGDDTLSGGSGDDTLDGGNGSDTASYTDATAGVTVALRVGTQATGGAGLDTFRGIEHLIGSAFADTLTGDGAANQLSGGVGTDVIEGGLGADTLSGGGNVDRFVFRSVQDIVAGERITDFFLGNVRDKIDLSLIDPDAALAGDQSFTFIGAAAFTTGGSNYQLRYEETGSSGNGNFVIEGDVNHDGVADFTIVVVINQDSGSTSGFLETDFML